MKSILIVGLVVSFICQPMSGWANESLEESEILAQRGKGVVTQTTFSARADKIPANIRRSTLRNGGRLRDMINSLLLRAQLAGDAREAGFDKEQIIIDRMLLAAENELAEAWVQQYVDIQPAADYEALAREYYDLNRADMLGTAKIDVSHILISSKERSLDEAKLLADSVSVQLSDNPASFDDLVLTYSEDPSASSNQGKFNNVKKGDMVKAFENAAFALEKGEISEPVKTEYGYHIIRLDNSYAPQTMSFDEAKGQLIERERKRHEDRIRQEYLSSLTSLDVEMSDQALQEMVKRQFGEDYSDAPAGDKESK